MMNKELVK